MGQRYVLLLIRGDKSPAQSIGCFATEKDASKYADIVLHVKRTQYVVVPYVGVPEMFIGG